MTSRATLVLGVATALTVVGGTTGAAAPSQSPVLPVSPAPAASPTLQPLVVSTQLWVGEDDLLLDLLDADGARLDDPGLEAVVTPTGPDGLARGQVALERIRFSQTGRDLYRARVALDAAGAWTAAVTARTGSGTPLAGWTAFRVIEDAGTPALGQPAVAVRTPTIGGSVHDLATITTDPDPLPQLYWSSLDEALRQHRPVLFVVDTVRPGVNSACGSAIGEARTVGGSFPGLITIHVEPYVSATGEQVLVDERQGPARIAPWVAAWGVTEPPWMFVIDRDGIVQAKFAGIFGTDELLSALRRVAPYMPGSH